MRILITGHYGGINLGDDAILCSLVASLRKIFGNSISFTVFSHNPRLTGEMVAVNAIKHVTFCSSIVKQIADMVKAINKSDLIIIGGGGLLQDEFNLKTIPRYLLPAIIGRLRHKRFVFYALGVGPLNTRYSKSLIRLVSSQAAFISVRDNESKETMAGLGLKEVDVVPDPVFLLPKCDEKMTRQILREEDIGQNRASRIGVSLREIYHTSRRKVRSMMELSEQQKQDIVLSLEKVAERTGGMLVFFCTDNVLDKKISEEISQRCKCDTRLITADKYCPTEFAGLLGSMDIVITMPLHSAIIASISHIPIVAIDYNPKVRNFMRLIGQEEYLLPVENLENLSSKVFQVWKKRAAIRDHLSREIGAIRKKSIEDLRRVIHNGCRVERSQNLGPTILAAMYVLPGFIPDHLIFKYLNR
jgi:polysaccharide pyruvyl transferase CsaB